MKAVLLLLSAALVSSSARAATECSDMSTIVSAQDVRQCLHDFPALERWKAYWKIDAPDNPSFLVQRKPRAPRFSKLDAESVDYIAVTGTFVGDEPSAGPGRARLIAPASWLWDLGYTAYGIGSAGQVWFFDQFGPFQHDHVITSITPDSWNERWTFADDCVKAAAGSLNAQQAALALKEAPLHDPKALQRMSLAELQALAARQGEFDAERSRLAQSRAWIARYRSLRGATKEVTKEFREFLYRPKLDQNSPTPELSRLAECGNRCF